MYSIMLIEDDRKITELLGNKLKNYGYRICLPSDFSDLKNEFLKFKPDLVLMDINLPFFDGFYWCRSIRQCSNVPMIFVSARTSDMDKVMAIDNGGDDFITKPFSYDVLLAKIKGILRRVYGSYASSDSNYLRCHDLVLYSDKNVVEFKDKSIELSKNEFTLLYHLVKNINKIVSRDKLLEILWSDTDFIDDNTLSVNVTRVRKKLETIGIKYAIVTKRGQGYELLDNWHSNFKGGESNEI
ncbi:MAG: response regulator transcription factor [Clostridiaceae bacterium]|nr:response regulator transcription factor [Clostridiaceae bacterium]